MFSSSLNQYQLAASVTTYSIEFDNKVLFGILK